jgi:hypothetical protein
MAKGSQFERDICRQLSLWWSEGKRDDVFWRTSGSGARAKTRSYKGKKTFGQNADIQATDPIGQPLIDLFSIECKRGYSNKLLSNLIDAPDSLNKELQKCFIQVLTDTKNSGSPFWLLVIKRDFGVPVVYFPQTFFIKCQSLGVIIKSVPYLVTKIKLNVLKWDETLFIYGMPLCNFLKKLRPVDVPELLRKG